MKIMLSRKKLLWATPVCALAVLSAILGDKYWYTMTVPKPVQEDDIREAVTRQGLGEQLTHCGPKGTACCMSIRGIGDPSDAFLGRFQGQFRKGSDCTYIEGNGFIPVEAKTGRAAATVEFGPINWRGRSAAELDVSVYCGLLCGVGGTFAARRERNGWIVESRVRWVS